MPAMINSNIAQSLNMLTQQVQGEHDDTGDNHQHLDQYSQHHLHILDDNLPNNNHWAENDKGMYLLQHIQDINGL